MGVFLGLALVFLLSVGLVIACYGLAITMTDTWAPLNFIMFQQPKSGYTDQLVNLWVDKPWRVDGKRIPCRLEHGYTEDETPKADRTLIVYSHGNAENLLQCAQFLQNMASAMQCDVVGYDYSGYGLNEADHFERSTEGVNLTLQTVVEHMVGQGYQRHNIILWGYSLGTGPSLHMGASMCQNHTPPKCVILLAPYSSILDVVKDVVPEGVANIFAERWNNVQSIMKVTCPTLILHGQSDGMISHEHSERLKQNQPNAKLILMPNTGHTQFSWPETIKEVQTWLP